MVDSTLDRTTIDVEKAAKLCVKKGVDSTLDRTTIDVEKAAKLCVKKGPLRLAAHEGRPDRPYTGEEDYSVALEQGCELEADLLSLAIGDAI